MLPSPACTVPRHLLGILPRERPSGFLTNYSHEWTVEAMEPLEVIDARALSAFVSLIRPSAQESRLIVRNRVDVACLAVITIRDGKFFEV